MVNCPAMDLVQAVRAYVMEMIRISGPGMKVLLMDKETTGVVSCACAHSEVMQQELYLFVRIDDQAKRVALKFLKCIVFIRGTPENVELLIRELRSPCYGQYFVFFSNVISKADLKQLAEADQSEVVREVCEVYADFVPLGPSLFTINLFKCYEGVQWAPHAMKRCLATLAAVLLALRKQVSVRYQASSEMAKSLADALRSLLAKESALFQSNASSSSSSSFNSSEALLLILDRRFDATTPLLNQWTYEAMVHELFGIRNNRVNLKSAPSVSADMSEVVLNELRDEFYAANKYSNFGEIAQNIKVMMEEFQRKSKTHERIESISDMKLFVEQYPQFRRMSGTLAKHVTLISELSRVAAEYNLLEVSETEQRLACHDDDHAKALQSVRHFLNHEKTSDLDSTRLVMLYALRFENHPSNELGALVNLLRKRGVPERYHRAVYDLLDFGGRKWRAVESPEMDPIKITKKFIKDLKGVENVFTQHKPTLLELVDELTKGRAKESNYPYACGYSQPGRASPQELIVFIIGGATYEESLAMHNFSQATGVKIILGGTCVHNGRTFIEEVASAASSSAIKARHVS